MSNSTPLNKTKHNLLIISAKITNESLQVGICKKCGSSLVRKWLLFFCMPFFCLNKNCNNGN